MKIYCNINFDIDDRVEELIGTDKFIKCRYGDDIIYARVIENHLGNAILESDARFKKDSNLYYLSQHYYLYDNALHVEEPEDIISIKDIISAKDYQEYLEDSKMYDKIAGKDLWVKVRDVVLNFNIYIKIIEKHDCLMTFNIFGYNMSKPLRRMVEHDELKNVVNREKTTSDYSNRYKIVKPVDIVSSDELLEMIDYDVDFGLDDENYDD